MVVLQVAIARLAASDGILGMDFQLDRRRLIGNFNLYLSV